jgi:hypothetical protein
MTIERKGEKRSVYDDGQGGGGKRRIEEYLAVRTADCAMINQPHLLISYFGKEDGISYSL